MEEQAWQGLVFEEPREAGVSGVEERAVGSEGERGIGHTFPWDFYPKFIRKQFKGFSRRTPRSGLHF